MPAYIFINALWLGQVKCSESKPNKSPRLTDTIKKPPHLIPFIIIFFAVSLLRQEVVFLIFFLSFAYMTWSIYDQGATKIKGDVNHSNAGALALVSQAVPVKYLRNNEKLKCTGNPVSVRISNQSGCCWHLSQPFSVVVGVDVDLKHLLSCLLVTVR